MNRRAQPSVKIGPAKVLVGRHYSPRIFSNASVYVNDASEVAPNWQSWSKEEFGAFSREHFKRRRGKMVIKIRG